MFVTTNAVLERSTEAVLYRWRWAALFVILTAEVMDLLDALVTTIAGPSILADLGGSDTLIQWLGAGYVLAMAVGLLTGGRLGDIYGRKRMFMLGALGFVAASLLCAFATGPGILIAARVLQGLFGALMLPQGLGMIKEMFPPSQMGAAFGAFGPVMGLSAVGGPILAGFLVDSDFFGTGWRMIFLINVPLGLGAIVAGWKLLPPGRGTAASRLDLAGVALFSVASGLLVYPLVQGREKDWPAWIFAMMALSFAVFAGFVRYQIMRQRNGRDPLIVASLFRKRAFTGGLVAGLAFFSWMIGFGLVFNLYIQLGLGYSPLKAGLSGVPQALGMVVGFVAANAGLMERLGRKLMHLGLGIMGVGVVAFALILDARGVGVTPWQLSPALGVVGLGMGLMMAPFFNTVLAGVSGEETGSASGALTSIQQLGGALGIAILGTVFFNHITDFAHAMDLVLWVEGGLLALAFVTIFLLPRRPISGAH